MTQARSVDDSRHYKSASRRQIAKANSGFDIRASFVIRASSFVIERAGSETSALLELAIGNSPGCARLPP